MMRLCRSISVQEDNGHSFYMRISETEVNCKLKQSCLAPNLKKKKFALCIDYHSVSHIYSLVMTINVFFPKKVGNFTN